MGRRVSVRRVVDREPDGRLRTADVVGDLLALDDDLAVIEGREGRTEVPRAYVVAARLAPPSTAMELELQAIAARGLRPAETGEVGGWVLRHDPAPLRRANSVLPLRAPGTTVVDALEQAAAWYAERGQPLLLSVPVEGRRLLDAELGERGYTREAETRLLAARLDHLPSGDAAGVTLTSGVDDAWLAAFRGGTGDAAVRDLLQRHDRVVFGAVVENGTALAIGRAVVDDGWLGVSALEVAPDARRQGLATRVLNALWAWGRTQDARRSYVQVELDNEPALTLYERVGYWPHHDQRYRRAPLTPQEPDVPAPIVTVTG